MPTLRIRFPGGRYHATPWAHHVNEGLIEWPPSPWRVVRALLACGFSSQGWSEVPDVARRLIYKVASVLPLYWLPAVTAAHSRHFMPLGMLKNGREDTTLVFDTWANVGNGELLIHWPCELTNDEFGLLRQLVFALGYLGRSESWVEAELIDNAFNEWNAEPCREGEHRRDGWEQVSLMAAIPPSEYESWRSEQVQEALRPIDGANNTADIKKNRDKRLAPYPADLAACLLKDTAWWKRHGWSQPPGSRRVLYWRKTEVLQVSVPRCAKPRQGRTVTTMMLSLTTPSGNRSALPPITRTLPQAELCHRALVGRAGLGQRIHCPELTGKDELGNPLKNDHAHAHVLPVDLDEDGHLDHIIIHAEMGLGDVAQRAIRSLKRTWTKGGAGELQLAVVGIGDIEILRQLELPIVHRILAPVGGARIWQSATPMILPRFLKTQGKNSLLGQINFELVSRGLPLAHEVSVDPDLTLELRHFIIRRGRGSEPPKVDQGWGLIIELKEPINGPLSLGYAAHYGLGLFHAMQKQEN